MTFAALLACLALAPQGPLRILGVEEFSVSGTVSHHYVARATQNLGVVGEHVEQHVVSATFRGVVRQTLVDEGQAEWSGEGELVYNLAKEKRSLTTFPNAGYQSELRTDSGNGTTKVEILLAVDVESGTYQWSVTPSDPEAGFPTRSRLTVAGTGRPSKTTVSTPPGTFPELAVDSVALPAQGLELAGSKPVVSNEHEDPARGISAVESTSRTTSWGFRPMAIRDHELVIVPPPGWREWLPDPYVEAGRMVEVRLLVQKKGGGAPTLQPKRITVRLMGTSAEPGECLNADSTGQSPDVTILRTEPESQPSAGGQTTEIDLLEAGATSARVVLRVADAAALTRLVASCEFVDGRATGGKVQGTGEPDLCLPRDDDQNRIGDAWEEERGCAGISPLEDDDDQTDNPNRGDGLTAFEEYRSVVTRGSLARNLRTAGGAKALDPRRKDLLVVNAGGALLEPGFTLFEQLSGIGVVVLVPGDLPADRLVNRHSDTGRGGDQFGVVVEINENPDPSSTKAVGASSGPRGREDKIPSPKDCMFVRVAPAKITRLAAEQERSNLSQGVAMPYTAAEQIAETVAHEVAHGVGVEHHCDADGNGDHGLLRLVCKDDPTRLIDPSGKHLPGLLSLVGGEFPEDLGVKPSVSSGDIECVMCYRNYYQWMNVWRDGKHYFVKLMPLPVGKGFCKTAAGTGWNARGRSLPPFFGDAERGNCLGQMRVKDW